MKVLRKHFVDFVDEEWRVLSMSLFRANGTYEGGKLSCRFYHLHHIVYITIVNLE